MVSVKSKIYYELLEKAWEIPGMESKYKIRISGHFLLLKNIERIRIRDHILLNLDALQKTEWIS